MDKQPKTICLLLHGIVISNTFKIPDGVFIITLATSNVPLPKLDLLRGIGRDISDVDKPVQPLFIGTKKTEHALRLERDVIAKSNAEIDAKIIEAREAIHKKEIAEDEGVRAIEILEQRKHRIPSFRLHMPGTMFSEHVLQLGESDDGRIDIRERGKSQKFTSLPDTTLSSFISTHGKGVYILLSCRTHKFNSYERFKQLLERSPGLLQLNFPTTEERETCRNILHAILINSKIPEGSSDYKFVMDEYDSTHKFDEQQQPIVPQRLVDIIASLYPKQKDRFEEIMLAHVLMHKYMFTSIGSGFLDKKIFIDAYNKHLSLDQLKLLLDDDIPVLSQMVRQRSADSDRHQSLNEQILHMLQFEPWIQYTGFFEQLLTKLSFIKKRKLLEVLRRLKQRVEHPMNTTIVLDHPAVRAFLGSSLSGNNVIVSIDGDHAIYKTADGSYMTINGDGDTAAYVPMYPNLLEDREILSIADDVSNPIDDVSLDVDDIDGGRRKSRRGKSRKRKSRRGKSRRGNLVK